jgi:tetratricopeptide (TPR) repeat protein
VNNELGAYPENVELLPALLADSTRMGLWNVASTAMSHLSKTELAQGRLMEAESSARKAIESFARHGDRRMEAVSRAYLARTLAQAGALEQAEYEARRAVETFGSFPTLEPLALAVLASVLLDGGRCAEALEPARRAAESAAVAEEGEAFVRLVHAEALRAVGDHAGARGAILFAKDRLLERAGQIASEVWRRRFLEDVAENARTLALARWCIAAG